MLNERSGKICRPGARPSFTRRDTIRREPNRVMVVDPVLASRVALAEAISQPGVRVETAGDGEEVRRAIGRQDFALVIAEQALGEGSGLELLRELREAHPETLRALVTEAGDGISAREAIDHAGLCFLVQKPLDAEALRETIAEVLDLGEPRSGWQSLAMPAEAVPYRDAGPARLRSPAGQHHLLLRGLLAGLNACEGEAELIELIHNELAGAFGVDRWLWVDETRGVGTRIAGDWPLEADVDLAELAMEEKRALERARSSIRVTRLDVARPGATRRPPASTCISMALRDGGQRALTCLVWVDPRFAGRLVQLLRDLHSGLQMAFRRIRDAEARAAAARRLAARVSEELRTPVGALTHAVDRLRGEAERAGLASEWVERVSCESERVVRAVQHVEDEMRADEASFASAPH